MTQVKREMTPMLGAIEVVNGVYIAEAIAEGAGKGLVKIAAASGITKLRDAVDAALIVAILPFHA